MHKKIFSGGYFLVILLMIIAVSTQLSLSMLHDLWLEQKTLMALRDLFYLSYH